MKTTPKMKKNAPEGEKNREWKKENGSITYFKEKMNTKPKNEEICTRMEEGKNQEVGKDFSSYSSPST